MTNAATHRAVLVIATPNAGEYWQLQRRRTRRVLWWQTEYWEGMGAAATQGEAQALVNRLEHDGVVYPSERAHGWLE